jgi:hypothetical protein
MIIFCDMVEVKFLLDEQDFEKLQRLQSVLGELDPKAFRSGSRKHAIQTCIRLTDEIFQRGAFDSLLALLIHSLPAIRSESPPTSPGNAIK